MRYITGVALLALALLAACGGASAGTNAQPTSPAPTLGSIQRPPAATQPASPAATPAAPAIPTSAAAPTASSAAPTDSGAIVIIYNKSGRFAGINDTLTVYADGTLKLENRRGEDKTAQVEPSELSKLRDLLASPEFAALQLSPPPVAPDQFAYELTVPGRAEPIVTVEGAQNTQILSQVIDELENLAARVK